MEKKWIIIVGLLIIGVIGGFVYLEKDKMMQQLISPQSQEGVIFHYETWDKKPDLMECLVKTSDNKGTDDQVKERAGNYKQGYVVTCKEPILWDNWTTVVDGVEYDDEGQPYNITHEENYPYYSIKWGNLETDPKRFAIIRIPASEYNTSWLEPEYDYEHPTCFDDDGDNIICTEKTPESNKEYPILTRRKYVLPLESFMTTKEIDDLKNISYGKEVNWTIQKEVTNLDSKIISNDYENRPADMKLHGSAGNFTICASGCNYSSLSDWEAGEQANLATAGAPCIATITGAIVDTNVLVFSGWTTTPDDYIKVTAISDQRASAEWDDSKYYLYNNDTATSALFVISNTIIDGIQIKLRVTGANNSRTIFLGGSNVTLENLNLNCDCGGTGSGNGVWTGTNAGFVNVSLINSVVTNYISGSDLGFRAIYPGFALNVYNSVIYNSARCTSVNTGGNITIINSAVFNCSNDDFDNINGPFLNISSCASDSGEGENGFTPADWGDVFVDYPNDFHLKATDTDLIDAGLDLSGFGFNNDIDGDTRSGTWDIGADEYVSGEPPAYSCDCPSADTNWEINLADNCQLNKTCNIDDGNITFTGTGNVWCNSTITCNSFTPLDVAGAYYFLNSSCVINVG